MSAAVWAIQNNAIPIEEGIVSSEPSDTLTDIVDNIGKLRYSAILVTFEMWNIFGSFVSASSG